MNCRRPAAPLAARLATLATLATVAIAAAGCGEGGDSQGLAASWETPSTTAAPSLAPLPSAPLSPSPSAPASQKAKAKRPSPAKAPTARYVFPVGGKPFSYARTHHDYAATDIIAKCGLPVRAATDGVVLEVSPVDKYDKAEDDAALRGGISVSFLGNDGVRYYGSHFGAVLSGIRPGVKVRAGQQLGKVGETGNASACHLHFGISPPCARTGDWWNRRGVIWPYTYLDAWRAGRNRSPRAAVATWKADHGCPSAP